MSNIEVPHLLKLVKRLNKPLSVYDLEATTFRGHPEFGIVEVAVCSILPDGRVLMYGSLINPEKTIQPAALATHGITQAMVQGKQTWGHKYAAHFHLLAKDHIISGFNIKTFDNHAVKEQNARYGVETEGFEAVIDARHYYRHAEGIKGTSGDLQTFSAALGIQPKGRPHRAECDVYMTVDMLEVLVAKHGEDSFIMELEGKKPRNTTPSSRGGSKVAVTVEAIAAAVSQGATTLAKLCLALGCTEAQLELPLCQAIDRGLVNPMLFAHEPTRQWMRNALAEVLARSPFEGKLKPLLAGLSAIAPADVKVSYLQLRVGLLDAGYVWGMLKAPAVAA